MANSEVSGMANKSIRRGRPKKQQHESSTSTNSASSNSGTQTNKSTKVKRDIYKVFSIKVAEGFEACAVRHGKDTVSILTRTNGQEWKPVTDKESVFYRMVERAARSKKQGAVLVGVYYDPNLALVPAGASGTYREVLQADISGTLTNTGG